MEGDPGRLYLTILIEEYKSLRDESKQASINMWMAMQWCAAIVGVVVGAGLIQFSRENPVPAVLAFGLAAPMLTSLSMVFWIGEAVRLKRVGDYIFILERKIALIMSTMNEIPAVVYKKWPQIQANLETALGIPAHSHNKSALPLLDPLSWEHWLRVQRQGFFSNGHLSFLYSMRLGFFLILSWGTASVAWFIFHNFSDNVDAGYFLQIFVCIGFIASVAATVVAVIFGVRLRRRMGSVPALADVKQVN